MERTNDAIMVWFWSRTDGSVPDDVRNAPPTIDTSTWGTPFANFPNTNCDISSHFGPNNIVVDLTFCMVSPLISLPYLAYRVSAGGDFAGAVFTSQGCGADCVCMCILLVQFHLY